LEVSVLKTSSLKIHVSPSIGDVSAEVIQPEKIKCILTLAHGAGAGMNHPFMIALANELALMDIGTIRFNFPFTEQKKKRPDVPAVAHKTIEAVIQKVKELFLTTPVFAGGKSFGGRMTSQYLSKKDSKEVRGIIFIGFPLHPAGTPSVERAEHLKEVNTPMLFLQGTRDDLAQWKLIEEVCASLPLAKLVKFEGADHSFKVPRQNILPTLATSIESWVTTID
jgi:uncharacterized protein